jgi:glutamate/tyrosine decarboxylase-like PLP-dependent enzyme
LHKWGFAPKGISIVLHRDPKYQKYQEFDFNDWPAGRYTSNTFTGTRPGGSLAAAWAVMNYLGEQGYLQIAKKVMETKQVLIDGINAIDGLQLFGNVGSGIITFGSQSFDILAVAKEMQNRSWFAARTSEPPAMHLVVTPIHSHTVVTFLSDLADVVKDVKAGKSIRKEKETIY